MAVDQYQNYALRAERNILVSFLQKARNKAMTNVAESRHGVIIQSGEYIIFEGNTYLTRNVADDEIIDQSPAITISDVTEYVFKQLTGEVVVPTVFPAVTTLSNGVKSIDITVNLEGMVNW